MTSSGDVIANDWWIPTSDGHELHIRQKVADPGTDSRRGVRAVMVRASDE